MIHFILNNRLIRTGQPAGLPLLDFIRYEQGLRGTKIGCRDIGSVNTAIQIEPDGEVMRRVSLSMGGVSPIPFFLFETSTFLTGKHLSESVLAEANVILQQEISPISDIRGTAAYKRLLARQLFYAHFVRLFPGRFSMRSLLGITHHIINNSCVFNFSPVKAA